MTGVIGAGRVVDAAASYVDDDGHVAFRLEFSGYSVYKDGVYRGKITAPCMADDPSEYPEWLIKN